MTAGRVGSWIAARCAYHGVAESEFGREAHFVGRLRRDALNAAGKASTRIVRPAHTPLRVLLSLVWHCVVVRKRWLRLIVGRWLSEGEVV